MTPLYKPRPKRWPQVSLKGFFVLVTLAGILCWLGVQVKWIRDRHKALASGEVVAVRFVKDSQTYQAWLYGHGYEGPYNTPICPGEALIRAPWSIRILGEKAVACIGLEERFDLDAAKRAEMHRLFPEAEILGDIFPKVIIRTGSHETDSDSPQ